MINNIKRVRKERTVFASTRRSKKKIKLRKEEKVVECIAILVFKFSVAGKLVLGTWPDTLRTTKASLQLSEHPISVGSRKAFVDF